jgi:hypothetical protein
MSFVANLQIPLRKRTTSTALKLEKRSRFVE